ncbi:MAG: thymidine kinase [Flammeovirgaceae bacterium]|jgi:thymidine kinase|nr:thymidine kinase [Flammeovirgaceae bacterium]|tara:strand:+ start:23797 stop:24357 length:561 start_codon:yes stop_codon:yes gene_type:complete
MLDLITPKRQSGQIEVICGSMFSGKTKELIRRLDAVSQEGKKIRVFKPSIDVRYSEDRIISHDAKSLNCLSVKNPMEMLNQLLDVEVIGIDEVQFFDDSIVHVVNMLANQGKRVILAGLDMDYKGNPFGPVPKLIGVAEFVTKLHATCTRCGGLASFSQRLSARDQTILLGEKEYYQAVCRKCFYG